jgi:hypothetical protein
MPYPATYDINYYKGDTFEAILYPKTSTGTSFPLTGYTAKFSIATAKGSSSIGATVFSATVTAGGTSITVASTTGMSVGQKLVLVTGPGAFGTNAFITAISGTTVTVSVAHATTGQVTFKTASSYDGYTSVSTVDSSITFAIAPYLNSVISAGSFLTPGTTYYYDVQIEDSTTNPYKHTYTLLQGSVTVSDQVAGAV